MAKRSAALVRAEKALSSARKRASDLRKRVKQDKPTEIGATIAGGFAAGWIDKENPEFIRNLGLENPSLIFGLGLVGYGLFSNRAGKLETVATAAGTGMLTAYAYTMAQSA